MKKKKKTENEKKWYYLGGGILLAVVLLCAAFVFLGKRNDFEANNYNATVLPAGGAVSLEMLYFSDPYYDIFFASSSDPIKLSVVSEESKKAEVTGSAMQMYKTKTGAFVYCIEKGNPAAIAKNPDRTLTSISDSTYWQKLTASQREAISLLMIYGYPNKERSGYTSEEQYAATQILIWEIQQKWRTNYNDIPQNQELYRRWVNTTKTAKIKELYTSILADLRNHNVVASFSKTNTSSLTATTLKYNSSTKKYEATLTDTNAMLANSIVTCPSGVECVKTGNILKVTTSNYDSISRTIAISKITPAGLSQGMLIIENANYQKMALGRGSVDPVTSYASVITETLGTLTIQKASEDGVKKGFKFRITGPSDYNQTFTTDDDGKITISSLPLGTYTISEIELDGKYQQPSSQTIELTSSSALKTINFSNVLVNNSKLTIAKVDGDTQELIAGAKLQIQNGETVVESWTTEKTAHEIQTKLDINVTYKLCEVEAPAGYVKRNDCQELKITDKNQQLKVVFENDKTTTTIQKVDENKKMIAGATLQVLSHDEKVIDEWVSVAGEAHIIKGLVIGQKYTLREKQAPEGYLVASDVVFTAQANTTVQMVNKKTTIEISKRDITTSKEIAGAHLQVLDANNAVIDEWVSEEGKTHQITGLLVGKTYTLKETVAPDGYVVAKEVQFTVLSTGVTKVVMNNELSTTVFSKQDATTGQEIAGAHLQVFDSEENLIEEWDSEEGKSHVIHGLIVGNSYILQETIAPDGYAISNEIVFIAGDDSKVVMENEPTTVLIYKKDVVSEQNLAGAHLQLLDQDGQVLEEWDTTEEAHVIVGLLTDYEYTIIETETPEDYLKTEEIKFSLYENEAKKEIVVYNTPIVYVPNTAADVSVIAMIIGGVLAIGGAGVIVWIKKRGTTN